MTNSPASFIHYQRCFWSDGLIRVGCAMTAPLCLQAMLATSAMALMTGSPRYALPTQPQLTYSAAPAAAFTAFKGTAFKGFIAAGISAAPQSRPRQLRVLMDPPDRLHRTATRILAGALSWALSRARNAEDVLLALVAPAAYGLLLGWRISARRSWRGVWHPALCSSGLYGGF